MEEAVPNQLPSGYDEDFVTVVEEDFQCLICHLPLKEPVQTRCGHRFCKECLEEHLRRCVVDNMTRMKLLIVHMLDLVFASGSNISKELKLTRLNKTRETQAKTLQPECFIHQYACMHALTRSASGTSH